MAKSKTEAEKTEPQAPRTRAELMEQRQAALIAEGAIDPNTLDALPPKPISGVPRPAAVDQNTVAAQYEMERAAEAAKGAIIKARAARSEE